MDGCDDARRVGLRQRDVSEILIKSEVDVSILKVMVVDLDGTTQGVGLGVDEPAGLPLTSPEVVEVEVDAADVDLQVALLVEAEAGTRRSILVVDFDVLVNGGFHASFVGAPLLVELFREIARVTKDSRLQGIRVERELDAELGVKVDKRVGWLALLRLDGVLTTDLRDHGDASIGQLDVLLVELEVLLERSLDVLVIEDLLVDDVAEVLEDHVDLSCG